MAKMQAPIEPLKLYQGTKQEQLQQLLGEWQDCTKCQLGLRRQAAKIPEIVFGDGNPEADVLIIGESPGEQEEKCFVPFVGPSGKLLNTMLASTTDDEEIRELHRWYVDCPRKGKEAEAAEESFHTQMLDWRQRNFFVTNALACRPTDGVEPSYPLLQACYERLRSIVYIVDPKVIIACGNPSFSAILRKAKVQITAMRGKVFDVVVDGRLGPVTYPVVPTFHPSFLLRCADWKVPGGNYDKAIGDWKLALSMAKFVRENG